MHRDADPSTARPRRKWHPGLSQDIGRDAVPRAQPARPVVNQRILEFEPAGADDACRSLKAGHILPMTDPRTIADGLRTSLGKKPFAETQRYVDDIVTVSEEAILQAMRSIWEIMKIIVEPSGAVAYAALVERKVAVANKRVGLILSGGNLDLDTLPWMKTQA